MSIFSALKRTAKFWKKVKTGANCWLWQGGFYGTGYGKFSRGSEKAVQAHRYAYCLAANCSLASIEGYMICHHCDVKACVNPAHLYKGNAVMNSRDAVERNRIKPHCPRGENASKAKLTEEDVLNIRRLHKQGVSQLALTRIYGLDKKASSIYKIVYRKSWTHLPEEL